MFLECVGKMFIDKLLNLFSPSAIQYLPVEHYVCMYVLWLPKFNHIRDSGVKVLCFLHLPSALHGTSMLMLGTYLFLSGKGRAFWFNVQLHCQ